MNVLIVSVAFSAVALIVNMARRGAIFYSGQIVEQSFILLLCAFALALHQTTPGVAALFFAILYLLGPELLERVGLSKYLFLLRWGSPGRFLRELEKTKLELDRGDTEALDKLLRSWVDQESSPSIRAELLVRIAPLLAMNERFSDCIDCYGRALANWPQIGQGTRGAIFHLALLRPYAELHQWSKVKQGLESFLGQPRAHVFMERSEWATVVTEILALSGDYETLKTWLERKQNLLPDYFRYYWTARCLLRNKKIERARAMLEKGRQLSVQQQRDRWTRGFSRWLERAQTAHFQPENQAQEFQESQIKELIERAEEQQNSFGAFEVTRLRPATSILIVACCATWSLEEWTGGSTDSGTLYRLGAVSLKLVLEGQGWRILTATFLHAGSIHLTVNCLALLLFGMRAEMIFGGWCILLIFLVSGALANLCSLPFVGAHLGVGASGGVMAMLGAVAAAFIRAPATTPIDLRREQIRNVGLLICGEAIFDRTDPTINGAAHLFGAAFGLLLGMLFFSERSVHLSGRMIVPRAGLITAVLIALLPGIPRAWTNHEALRYLALAQEELADKGVENTSLSPTRLLELALSKNPKSVAALELLGEIRLLQSNYFDSLALETRVIDLIPIEPEPYDIRSQALYRLGSFRNSLDDCQAALRFHSRNPQVSAIAALDAFSLGENHLAIRYAEAYPRDQPLASYMVLIGYFADWQVNHRPDLIRLTPLLRQNSLFARLVITSTSIAATEHPDPDTYFCLALQAWLSGNRKAAVHLLEMARQSMPTSSLFYPMLRSLPGTFGRSLDFLYPTSLGMLNIEQALCSSN